jgi:hypothetical protein
MEAFTGGVLKLFHIIVDTHRDLLRQEVSPPLIVSMLGLQRSMVDVVSRMSIGGMEASGSGSGSDESELGSASSESGSGSETVPPPTATAAPPTVRGIPEQQFELNIAIDPETEEMIRLFTSLPSSVTAPMLLQYIASTVGPRRPDAPQRRITLEQFMASTVEVVPPYTGECSVCQFSMENAAPHSVRRIPACGHTFHTACLQPWVVNANNNSCPMCRASIVP